MSTVVTIIIILVLIIDLIKLILFVKDRAIAAHTSKQRPEMLVNQDEVVQVNVQGEAVKAMQEAVVPIKPILEFWEDDVASEFGGHVGEELHTRIKNSKNVLKKHGIRRRVRADVYSIASSDKGRFERKWDDGGKVWQASDMNASLFEEYYSVSDNSLIDSRWFIPMHITAIKSRRLNASDKQDANSRDKWGRKKKEKNYYEGQNLTICPSCGAELPADQKDPVCPYCNATIFADYYDWQMEALEFNPEEIRYRGVIGGIIEFFADDKIGTRVKYRKKKKGKSPIVRFSENGFRGDVYRDCIEHSDANKLIDLWLGVIDIRRIRNTVADTIVDIRVPVYRTMISADNKIEHTQEVLKASYIRARYPNKFNKEDAVISAERTCPSCGGEYAVDADGCCIHCGTYLMKDTTHWKRL